MLPQHVSAFTTSAQQALEHLPHGVKDFKEMGVFGWLLVDLAINWAGWAVAAAFKTEKFYDMLGSVSFLTCTIGSLLTGGASGARKFVVSGMVVMWGVRLGTYLVTRIMQTGKDARFDEIKHSPAKFWVAWTLQAVWVWVTLLPVLIVNGMPNPAALRGWDAVGIAIFGVGFALEVVADWQKASFKSRPENKGRFINEGLWSLSRHPNYFGEMMLWWGVLITCAPAFNQPWHWASITSPVLVFMILRFLSGVPMLEEMADKRWGNVPAYQQYKAETPLLLPLPKFKDTHAQ